MDGFATVAISDTGRGIPPEHLANIFRPFFTTKSEAPDWGCLWRAHRRGPRRATRGREHSWAGQPIHGVVCRSASSLKLRSKRRLRSNLE